MTEYPSAAEVARDLADALESEGIPYAIGGALALGFYATPRATVDIDVNVFLPPASGFDLTLEVLERAGFVGADSHDVMKSTAREEGQFRGHVKRMRVDVFVPAIDFYAQLEDRMQQVVLFDRPIWILGAEDLAILKLLFFRPKDLVDVDAIMRDQGRTLDRTYIRSTLVDLVGNDDARIVALDELERDVDSSGDDA